MNVSSEPILRFVEEFEDDYKSAIAYLGDYPAKPLINSLTIMAGEVTSTSPLVVVQVIEDEIINANNARLVNLYYVMDSIVKNIQGIYRELFAQRLPSIFTQSFRKVDQQTRNRLTRLMSTWEEKRIFDDFTLRQLRSSIANANFDQSISTSVKSRPEKHRSQLNTLEDLLDYLWRAMDTPPNERLSFQEISEISPITRRVFIAAVEGRFTDVYESTLPTQLAPSTPPDVSIESHNFESISIPEFRTSFHPPVISSVIENTEISQRDSVLSSLYNHRYVQCKTCGFRFRQEEDLKEHMSWHFQMNSAKLNKTRRIRLWFRSIKDWIKGENRLILPETTEHKFTTEMHTHHSYVKATEEENCIVCGDKFDRTFDRTINEWIFVEAVQLPDGVIVHSQCQSDYFPASPRLKRENSSFSNDGYMQGNMNSTLHAIKQESPRTPEESEETFADFQVKRAKYM